MTPATYSRVTGTGCTRPPNRRTAFPTILHLLWRDLRPTLGCPDPARVSWTIGDMIVFRTLGLFQRLTLTVRPFQRIAQRAADD